MSITGLPTSWRDQAHDGPAERASSAIGNAYDRPVGVVLDKQGAFLVDYDVGNGVWRVTAAASTK